MRGLVQAGCPRWLHERPRSLVGAGKRQPREGCSPAGSRGGGTPSGAQQQPRGRLRGAVRRKSRSCSILLVGEGPGVRGAAAGGGEHAPGPLAESWGLEGADETGEPKPQEGAPTIPEGKALEEKRYLPLPPCLGGRLPHTPTLGKQQCVCGV